MAAEEGGGGKVRKKNTGGEMFAKRAAVWTRCQRVRKGGE